MATLLTGPDLVVGSIKGPMVRLAYSKSLFTPSVVPGSPAGSPPKYNCTLIVKKTDKVIRRALEEAVIDCIRNTPGWGDSMIKKMEEFKKKGMDSPVKLPILDGLKSINKKTGELNAGFDESVVFIRVQSGETVAPVVRSTSETVPATNAEVYSGCYGKAVVNAFSWSHPTGGAGVTFGIRYFQKLRDGDSLGGAAPLDPGKYFEQVGEEAQEDAPEEARTGAGSGGLFA